MLHIHAKKRNFYELKIGGGPDFIYRNQDTNFGTFISLGNKTVLTGLTQTFWSTLWRYLV